MAGLALELLRTRRACASLREDCARATALRLEERAGRTAAEVRLRRQQQRQPQSPPPQQEEPGSAATSAAAPDAPPPACTYRPIGRIASCYVERRGTPRQGLLAPAARAHLKLLRNAAVQPEPALEGLAGFSHVWLLYDFHENTNAAKLGGQQVRAKVHPPGMAGAKTGLYSTRTPHRPNPIGLTCARLVEVRGDTLVLGGADLVDGTPVLDVKPYLRHDVQLDAGVPAWCENRTDASRIVEVRYAAEAEAQLAALVPHLRFYDSLDATRSAIEQTLQLDIRSVHQGRGQPAHGQRYSVNFDAATIEFETFEAHVLVTSVARRRGWAVT